MAGTFLRTEQEDGLFHPRLVRDRNLIGKRAGDRSVVTDYDRRDGRSTRLAVTFARGQCLCTLIHFLFLRTVDEDGGKFLFGFTAFKHGGHGQGFVRRHLQVLKVYGKFHSQVSVSQREMLSGDKQFSPVELLPGAEATYGEQKCQCQRNTD